MTQSGTSKSRIGKKYRFFLGFGVILLVAAALLVRPWERRAGSNEPAGVINISPSADSSAPIIPELPPQAPIPQTPRGAGVHKKVFTPKSAGRPEAAPGPSTLAGTVDSWEDWNSSFSDTVTRTYSAIFDSARLDTASGARLVFAASGRSEDLLRVKRVFCIVDSVKPLVKYTFPGVHVDFGIGVGFEAGVSFKGALEPRVKAFGLDLEPAGDERFKDEGSMARNQFLVALHSPPGYAYTLRTGIECFIEGRDSQITRIYFTPPARVEFRRMIRFQSLLAQSGDTLFILTSNPRAISDLAKAAPLSWISAVFVPVQDPSESEDLVKEQAPRLRVHVSPPRSLEKSFVILNDSVALVEKNVMDPEFRRTAQLKLKDLQLNRTGLPRVTTLVRGESEVEELKLLFIHFDRLPPR